MIVGCKSVSGLFIGRKAHDERLQRLTLAEDYSEPLSCTLLGLLRRTK